MKRKSSIAIALFLALLMLPIAFAAYYSTTSWGSLTFNATNSTLAATTIGTGYTKTLGTFSFTNVSGVTNCTSLKWLLQYDSSNTSWYQNTNQDLSAYSAKVVKPYFNASTHTGAGCALTGIQLTWQPGGSIDSDTIQGLPTLGSDTGNFLKNLAPGVGAFIIILGVFAAIGGIIYAIVGVVQSKVMV